MSGLSALIRLAASALVTGLLVAACTPRPEPESDSESRSNGDVSPARQETPSTEARIGDEVLMRLTVDPGASGTEQPFEFTLTVVNESAEELVLDFPNGQRFDFEVVGGGDSSWRWSTDMFFPQMLGRERVPAGDEIVWTASSASSFSPGHYTVRATMTTNEPVTIELELDVNEGESMP